MLQRSREDLGPDGLPTTQMLRSALAEHRAGLPRLQRLRAAYDGRSPILSRRRARGLPNNRLVHPYARYITAVSTGYLIGRPVTYHTARPNGTMERIRELFLRGSESAENAQIARNASIYGKGLEYVHLDAGDPPMPHTTAVSSENGFVVYEDRYDLKPLFGVYYTPRTAEDGSEKGFRIWVMTEDAVALYEAAALDAVEAPVCVTPHFFGGVPLIEYWNDDDERGDFESVLSLIEAYDLLESDRLNDKEQFVDRLLLLTGVTIERDARGREPWQQLREDKALCLPDTMARAEYLGGEMHEGDAEILRKALLEDIHKLSMVPDLSDQSFAANLSGVAMRYKLWGLEQAVGVKERWFLEGLRERLRLYIHYLTMRGSEPLALSEVRIAFSRAMPENVMELSEIARTAAEAGAASTQTLVAMLHRGEEWTREDIQREVQTIHKERGQPGESEPEKKKEG